MSQYTTWQELSSLSETMMETLKTTMKHEKVTKTQAAVIPLFMENKDVVVKACTGSGKTLAFLVPCFERLMKQEADQGIKILILAPSRELVV